MGRVIPSMRTKSIARQKKQHGNCFSFALHSEHAEQRTYQLAEADSKHLSRSKCNAASHLGNSLGMLHDQRVAAKLLAWPPEQPPASSK